jgi:hypothetical protein
VGVAWAWAWAWRSRGLSPLLVMFMHKVNISRAHAQVRVLWLRVMLHFVACAIVRHYVYSWGQINPHKATYQIAAFVGASPRRARSGAAKVLEASAAEACRLRPEPVRASSQGQVVFSGKRSSLCLRPHPRNTPTAIIHTVQGAVPTNDRFGPQSSSRQLDIGMSWDFHRGRNAP